MPSLDNVLQTAGQRPVALVYPAYTMASYAVIRNLGERGVPVIALNNGPHPHMRSRWVAPYQCPSFADDPHGFIRSLKELAARLPGGAVLYLMEDAFVYMIHRFRDELPENLHFPFMDDAALTMSVDKLPMFEAAERAGLPLPVTFYPSTMDELEALKDQIPFPCLIKPLVSRFSCGDGPEAEAIGLFPQTFGGKCVRADDFETLRTLFGRVLALGISVCVQEFLEGPISGLVLVHLYADARHDVLGAVTCRKLRQLPADFGTATLCDLARRDEALEYARRFVKEARFHGIGGIEFREDRRTGQLKLMEINPRGMYGFGVSMLGGVELPYLQYADLIGMPMRQEQTRFSPRWVDARNDLAYWREYRNHPNPDYRVSLGQWLASLVGATPAVLNWRDPVPGLIGLIPRQVGWAYLEWKARFRRREEAPAASI